MAVERDSGRFWTWILIGSILVIVSIAMNRYVLTTTKLDVRVDPPTLFPDGSSTATVRLVPMNALNLETPFQTMKIRYRVEEGRELVDISLSPDSTSLIVRAKYETGSVTLLLSTDAFPLPVTVTINIESRLADGDRDGYPDAAELTSEEDRINFTRWFASIAESQYYRIDPSWKPEERDCAGLIRFACREALKRHSPEWFGKRRFLVDGNIPDVRKFHYPDIPLLGEKLFRIAAGSFEEGDTTEAWGKFSVFAEVKLLKEHSFFFSRVISPGPAREMSCST